MDKETLKNQIETHIQNQNITKANELLHKYIDHKDTTKEEIDTLISESLNKIRENSAKKLGEIQPCPNKE